MLTFEYSFAGFLSDDYPVKILNVFKMLKNKVLSMGGVMKVRKVRGKEVLDKAKDLLAKARTADELRQAQAVILPLEFGLSVSQTANIIGVSKSWASRLRSEFILAGGEIKKPQSNIGHREKMSREEEAEFLVPFIEKAKVDGKFIVSEVKEALQTRLGRTIAQRSVYNLLYRHDWRKFVPDKRRLSLNKELPEDFENKPNANNLS